MKGGFRYSFRKTVRRGRGSKKYSGKGLRSRKQRKQRKSRRQRKHRKHRRHRKSMRGGMQALTPADIQGQNTIIGGDQPHVGPNFNQSAGYGFKFSNPALGGSFEPNSQCEQYTN